MRKRIVLINAYFGKLPCWMNLWLKSCEKNKTINWLLITDDRQKYSYPANVKVIYMTLEEMKNLIDERLHIKNKIKNPYKLCDFKPTYGIVFQEYIKEFDFWGHCDIDLIFGDLRKYLTEDILNKYTKILKRGHLTLYKNDSIANDYYKLAINYIEILEDENNRVFDEWSGIVKVLDQNNIPQYHDEFIADIMPKRKKFLTTKSNNFSYQVFFWENGKIYRQYIENHVNKREEFAYIHFQKRKFSNENIDPNIKDSFFIGPDGFKVYHELVEKKEYRELNKDDIFYILKNIFDRVKRKVVSTYYKIRK